MATEYLMEAYGDSGAVGASDNCRYEGAVYVCDGYNRRFANQLEADSGVPVTLTNRSVSGSKMQHIYTKMFWSKPAIQQADVITWDGGGNDWGAARRLYKENRCSGEQCLRDAVADFQLYANGVFTLIANNKKPTALVKATSVFYPTVDEDINDGTYLVLAKYLMQMTEYVKQLAQNKGYDYADMVTIFNGPGRYTQPQDPYYDLNLLPSPGNAHPTGTGHELIKDAMVATGYDPLI